MKLIKLLDKGQEIYINPNNVAYVQKFNSNSTTIVFNGNATNVSIDQPIDNVIEKLNS